MYASSHPARNDKRYAFRVGVRELDVLADRVEEWIGGRSGGWVEEVASAQDVVVVVIESIWGGRILVD